MAKVSSSSIPDISADWGDDGSGLPYSGEAVQTFIKDELKDRLKWDVIEPDVVKPTKEEAYVKTTSQSLTNKQKETVMSNLGMEDYVNSQIDGSVKSTLQDYITKEELNNRNYVTDVDDKLSGDSENPVQNKVITEELNKKANIEAIPTKTSELTNNSEFITSKEAQEEYQPKGNYLTEIPSEYITDEELGNKNYTTKDELTEAISNAITEAKSDVTSDYTEAISTSTTDITTAYKQYVKEYIGLVLDTEL